MHKLLARRSLNVFGAAMCAALLGYAYYLELVAGLDPCPLCILQRIAVLGLAILFLAAAIHHPGRGGARVYGLLLALTALAGGAVAGRHVWLQSLPPERVPECGPGLAYMLDVFPLTETVRMVLTGSGECAEVSWSFAGLSMPAWVLVWFALLGVGGLVRNLRAGSA